MVLGLLKEKGFSKFCISNIRSSLFIGLIIVAKNNSHVVTLNKP